MRTFDDEGATLTLQLQPADKEEVQDAAAFEHTLPGLPSDLAPLDPRRIRFA